MMEVLRTVVVAVLAVATWGQIETGTDQGTGGTLHSTAH